MRMLEVACRRCERRGRLSIARLIAEHGRDNHGDLRALIDHARNTIVASWNTDPNHHPIVRIPCDLTLIARHRAADQTKACLAVGSR
jgi:hypothetical protein